MNICVRGGLRVSKIEKDPEEKPEHRHCTLIMATEDKCDSDSRSLRIIIKS